MVSQQERARWMEAYKDEPVYAAAALIKSVVCLLLIGGVAVIGARSDFSDDAAQLQSQQVRDRSNVITASVHCLDRAPRVSAQMPETLRTASAHSADARYQSYVFKNTAIQSC